MTLKEHVSSRTLTLNSIIGSSVPIRDSSIGRSSHVTLEEHRSWKAFNLTLPNTEVPCVTLNRTCSSIKCTKRKARVLKEGAQNCGKGGASQTLGCSAQGAGGAKQCEYSQSRHHAHERALMSFEARL